MSTDIKKIIVASGPVIIENGEVLLNKHGDDKFWKFLGGKVQVSDSINLWTPWNMLVGVR
ncbi:MAG: NUDIX hydrolase [Candidatus Komeilibacteria bacterium]